MFSLSSEPHEQMTTSPPLGHGHGGQSQFLPGYLLGDHAPHGMSSPKLWSASGLSPGHRTSSGSTPVQHQHHQTPVVARPVSRGESVKGRTGGPPVRSLLSQSASEPSFAASPGQPHTPASAAARVASPGPPTSGLFGTPGGSSLRGELSFSQTGAIPTSPSQLDPFYTQGESLKADDILDETWVTIFGFPPGATGFMIQQFSQYGNILRHVPSAEGNWMHVHYQSKLQAKKALSKNGKVFGGRMMIGVLPCIDKNVMEEKENTEIGLTPVTPQTAGILDPTCVRSPATPIRPLTAAYAAARTEYDVLKNKQTPRKDNSIVSKVKEYMFGW